MTDNTSMLERMAKAAWRTMVADPDNDTWPDTGLSVDADAFRTAARAALQAIREPTPEMSISGGIAMCEARDTAETAVDEAAAGWTAMIDAILSEDPTNG